MSKELEDLLRRVSELEKQVKNGSFSAFGRSYSSIGSSSSDFVIKTKGQVKIQWGNKFIDLIKDGKINVNSKFIYTVDTQDNIGNKDGIYVTSDGSVYVKSGDTIISLVGEIGTTYVSFMEEQQTTSDQKHTALKNIGFIYDSLEQVDSTALQNGLIYVQDQHKIYLVRNGQLEEFKLEIPNPFTQQFVIQKSDSSQGALLIRGSGINNSLAFESLYLYVDEGNSYFDSEGNIEFIVDGNTIVNISKDRTTINNITQSNTFQSINAGSDSGFRLYVENGESTLEVDNIIERNKKNSINVDVFPEFFSKRNNIIVSVEQTSDPGMGSGYAIKLKYENQYEVGDYLYTYGEVQVNDFCTKLIKIPLTVGILDTETDNVIYAQIVSGFSNEVDQLTSIPNLEGKIIFLISSDKEIQQLRYSEENMDLLQYQEFSEEQDKASVKARVGDLTELELKGKDNGQEVPIEGFGVFAENGAFKQAQYKSDYFLDDVDNSSKFASTEWVNSKSIAIAVDLTAYSQEVDPNEYFSQSFIQNIYNAQNDFTVRSYSGEHGILTIDKNSSGISTFSALVRASWKGTWSHRSINAQYQNGVCIASSTYIIKGPFNSGYYYSKEQQGGNPVSPIYIGSNQNDFQVNSVNKYLWYTNDGDIWELVQEYISPVQNTLYIRTTTRNFYAVENVYSPAGFVCYNNGTSNIAIGDGRGVSNYIKVLDENDERESLSLLQSIESIAVKGKIPTMDGYNWLWSLKSGADPTKYNSWKLVSGTDNSIPVVYNLDKLSFGNCGGVTSSAIWTEVNSSGINIGPVDSSYLTNGEGSQSDWENPAFVKAFLVTTFSEFLKNNMVRYTPTLGWTFNHTSIVHLKGWGGYVNFYIGTPEDPTSDDAENIDSLPKSVFLQVNGSVFCNGHKADFYFDSVSPGLKIDVGQCYQENIDVGKTADITTFFDITYKGLRVLVTDLPQVG